MADSGLLIDGCIIAGAGRIDVTNPATGQIFAEAPTASLAQLDMAVAAARRAFSGWSSTPVEERRALLLRLADAIDEETDVLARTLMTEHGMPITAARFEVFLLGIKLRDAAAADVGPRAIEAGEGRHVVRHLRAVGPVAAIIPWNVPLTLLGGKIAPALLLGNTVVAKPSPTTPLTTLMVGRIAADILPAGVLNIVTDDGSLGGPLVSHPDIRIVSFTGSTATGRRVAAAAGQNLRRTLLELGGNDAAIVLPDADMALAARTIHASAFFNAGQACIATKRVYVHSDVRTAFCDALAAEVLTMHVGDGVNESVTCGPLQNRAHYQRSREFLAEAHRGQVIAEAQVPAGEGFFIPPTLVIGLSDDSPLVAQEQFCPILPILDYEDVDEAISRVNATPYGLAASVFGGAEAQIVASRIEAGTVAINKLIDFDKRIPFCGAKESGIGIESGEEGLLHYAQLQIVNAAA